MLYVHKAMKKKTVEQKYVSREKFVIEMNAKNTAYAFILQNGLFFQFKAFCEKMRAEEQDAHSVAIGCLLDGTATGGKVVREQQPTPEKQQTPEQCAQVETPTESNEPEK